MPKYRTETESPGETVIRDIPIENEVFAQKA